MGVARCKIGAAMASLLHVAPYQGSQSCLSRDVFCMIPVLLREQVIK